MTLTAIISYMFLAMAACAAIAILFSKNVFKSALLLLTSLLALAAIYVLSFAEFVAVAQILIYAGGIVIVIIFGVMLTIKISGKALTVNNAHVFSGILAGGMLLFGLLKFVPQAFPDGKLNTVTSTNRITDTGIQLMSSYLLPFEIAGILLLLALIGAAVISSSINKKV